MAAWSSNACPKVYRRNQAAVRLRRSEKKKRGNSGWCSRWKGVETRERDRGKGGGTKEEFCMSDYLERRRPLCNFQDVEEPFDVPACLYRRIASRSLSRYREQEEQRWR